MKNTLVDMHNILFAELETLADDSIKEKKLDEEIKRAKAMSGIATTIIRGATVLLQGQKANEEYGRKIAPRIITGQKSEYELGADQ
jgi:protein-disulfide isomerase